MILNEAYQEEKRRLIINFLPNISAYSQENLCPELVICMASRENTERFDKYCSGNYKTCPYKISTN
ncbi:hypothetical protein KAT80_00015 [Candidatus Pacearchaeota archaeon]|nr:hypothetical protein [Candidatus Pacearchaeota archaeon]